MARTKLDAIEARVNAVTECDCDEDATWCRHMTELTVNRSFVPMLLRSRTDVPLLLAAVRAAAMLHKSIGPLALITLGDAEYDALTVALAPLLEPEP